MLNQQTQIQRLTSLVVTWIVQIRTYNFESYTDINKAGEDLSRRLLNLLLS